MESTTPLNLVHSVLIQQSAIWLRKKCALVITDMASSAFETADSIGWQGALSTLIECKASLADFRADAQKSFRREPERGMGCKRYFCTMRGLLNPEKLPDKWGLLEWDGKKMRETKPAERQAESNARAEILLLISALRRIGANAPQGISVRCYTLPTKDRATLGIAPSVEKGTAKA